MIENVFVQVSWPEQNNSADETKQDKTEIAVRLVSASSDNSVKVTALTAIFSTSMALSLLSGC